jgi:Concanavalin A-like lectin/glucanases superfamily
VVPFLLFGDASTGGEIMHLPLRVRVASAVIGLVVLAGCLIQPVPDDELLKRNHRKQQPPDTTIVPPPPDTIPIPPPPPPPPPPPSSALFASGFDVASVNDLIGVGKWDTTQLWNGGTFTIESAITHSGKSLKCSVPAYDGSNLPKASILKSIQEWGEGKSLYADFWLRLDAASNYTFVAFFDVEDPDYQGGQAPGWRLWFTNSRVIRGAVKGESTYLQQLSANQFPQNTWCHIQVYLLFSDKPSVGHCTVWRDGTMIMDGAIKTLPTGGSSQRVEVGATASNSSVPNTIYVDDVQIYNQRPTSWP